MKNPFRLYLGVCGLAALFCVYAVITDGWQSASSTVFWTIGIFGSVTIIWKVGDKLSKK